MNNKPYIILATLLLVTGCTTTTPVTNENQSNQNVLVNNTVNVTKTNTPTTTSEPVMAFFYQTVGQFMNGVGTNTVKVGTTTDGVAIDIFDETTVSWDQGPSAVDSLPYGDPVVSYLPNGRWTLTAWTTKDDPRGSAAILYHESSCPIVDHDAVVAFVPSTAEGCTEVGGLQIGKSSQVFAYEESTYLFHTAARAVHLAKLSDTTHQATELSELCPLPISVTTLADLNWGETTPVVSSDTLLLSDAAIARRADGTWVLFVKGVPENSGCETGGGLCELCARGIYRTTSTDLINWSELEQVVEQASVPEVTQTTAGQVHLYWQDFSDACSAQNLQLAATAPISTAYETNDNYILSEPERIVISGEEFETNPTSHYATNGNPVMLPDTAAAEALAACFE